MSAGYRARAQLRSCVKPPEPRRWLGDVDGERLQFRAMELYPVNLAERWLAAIAYLRQHSKVGWRLDQPKEKP